MTTNNEQNRKPQLAIFPRACALALTALVAVGCGADVGDDSTSSALEADVPCGETEADGGAIAPETDGGKDTPNPVGAYYAKVTANGTGCRPGTWNAAISKDGSSFTMTFDEYSATIAPNSDATVAVKDCQLAIKIHSPEGLSYRIKNLAFAGTAFLEQGVQARLFATHYFQGNPVQSEQTRADLVGPVDDTFVFEDKIATTDGDVWSPCGVERDLNIATRLRLQNVNPKRTGFVEVDNLLGLELEWRSCHAGEAKPPADEARSARVGG